LAQDGLIGFDSMAVLDIEGLSKSYGDTKAVQDVTFAVEHGDVFGLVGPNGSGKTTTLGCALGMLRADAGRVSLLGTPAEAIHRTRGRVGVVFDKTTLVDGLTCEQNLQYTRRLLGHDGGRPDAEALELTGIGDLANRRAGRLSLGQRRRLSIARALIGKPELIVLDEPLSGLDTVGVTNMLKLFATLRENGMTLVLSSHRLHEMETLVNRVAILMGGRLVAYQSVDELLQGGKPRLRVRATPADRAQQVIAGLDGIESVEEWKEGELVVQPGAVPSAAVNTALVAAGCEVSALVPERITLQSAFEALVEPDTVTT
jgi:ABC-2 type transport system ATP-binding protein